MAATSIVIQGQQEAIAFLNTLKSGAEAADRLLVLVGSSVRYARYVHEGTRRMRGRPFLADALRAVEPRIKGTMALALPKGPHAVHDALLRLGHEVQRGAQAQAPVKTGTLRRSIHTVAAARGGPR